MNSFLKSLRALLVVALASFAVESKAAVSPYSLSISPDKTSYASGGTTTFTVTMGYQVGLSGLLLAVEAPTGWTYGALTATGASVPAVAPGLNDSGRFEFLYSNFPTVPGPISFTFTVKSPAAATTAQVFKNIKATFVDEGSVETVVSLADITIAPALSAIKSIPSQSLTAGSAAPSFIPVTAQNGSSPYTYAITPALPSALSLNLATGAITGTPAATAAATDYTVTITDATTTTASNTFSLTINSALGTTVGVGSKALTINTGAVAFTPVTASAGTSPYTYAITGAPALPAGLSINANTGAISGTPTVTSASTTYTVTATDAAGATSSKTFTLVVNSALTTSQTLPVWSLTVGQNTPPPTLIPVTGAGGTTPYSYSVAPALPAGVALSSSTGALSGAPSSAQSAATYTVTVTDAAGATATNTFSLGVNPAIAATQVVSTSALTVNTAAVAFTPVTVSGGSGPYTYTIAPTLPAGLAFAGASGAVSGIPTAVATAAVYTVTIRDLNNAQATNTFNLTVNPALTSTVAVATKGLTLNSAVVAFTPITKAGGTSPFAFAVSPALPAGLTLNTADGSVSGTPTAATAAADYTVTITDGAGATTNKPFNLTVNAALVATQAIATRDVTAGAAITAFTPVTATGGTAPLVFSVSPALPSGLSINSGSGAISGNPTVAAALAPYTVTVTDGAGATANASFTLNVNGPLSASVASATRTLTVGGLAPAFAPVIGGGGTGPYTYAISPSLPAGLTFTGATGEISGSPTTATAAANFTVTVTDATTATATGAFSLTVNAALSATQAIAARAITAGSPVVSFIPVTGAAGTAPYAYSVNPPLPANLNLNPMTGAITGTATTAASSTAYTVMVGDSAFATATNTFDLTVNVPLAAGTTLASRTLSAGTAAASFTPLSLSGGTIPYVWTVSPALPANLSIATGSGAITGTPSAALTSTNFTVTGTDAAGAQVSQVFALVINPALTTAQALATVGPLSAGTAMIAAATPVTAAGGTAPYSFVVAPALPTGLSLNATTGEISGTPTSASSATTYTVTATDSVGATSSKTFSLTVNGPLAATQAIAVKFLTATATATAFTPVTAGGGTTPYAFSVAPALPAGLILSATTGAITGAATTATPAAPYTITITDAAAGSVNAAFNLLVNPALTSTLDVATKGLTVGTPAMPFAPVTPAAGTLPYAFSVAPALPAGLSLDTATGIISGTPGAAAATANYTVTVTDSAEATTSKVLALTVNATPTPVAGQTIASKALTASSNVVAFTPLPLTGGTLPFTYTVAPALPSGLLLNATTGAITGNATAPAASALYAITAVDAAGAMATHGLTLVVNPALVATQAIASTILLSNTPAAAITPVTIAGGTAPFTYAVSPALSAGLSFNTTTGAVTGTPTATTGPITHTVTITDAAAATANATFSLKVNQIPAITTQPSANPSYLVGAPLTLTAAANGSPAPTYQWRKAGSDLPGKTAATLVFAALALTDAGSYDVVATNESGFATSNAVSFLVYQPPTILTQPSDQTVVAGQTATLSVSAAGDPAPTYQWRRNGLNIVNGTGATLTLNNVSFDAGGAYSVVISNPGGSITSGSAILTVNPVAPLITSPAAVTAVLGRSFLFQVSSTATSATYTATGLPAGLVINATSGAISGIPTASGPATVTVTATNVTGSDTQTLTITVNPPPPIINSAAAATGRVNVLFNFAVLAVNTPSSFAAVGLPAGLSINGSGVISGTPTASGVFNVTLSATNTGGTTNSPLQITIDPPLNAPNFTGSTNLSGVQGAAFSFTPAFTGAPFTANFTATGMPAGVTLTNAATGTISGTPTVTGSFSVAITATNSGGTKSVTFSLTINPAATAPVITSASTVAARVGSLFSFQLTSSGTPPANAYSATILPSLGLSLAADTGIISGTPTAPGTLTIQVGAANTVGSGPKSVLVISVSPSLNAPVITSSPVAPGRVGDVFSYTLAASNSPSGFIQTSGALPAGLSLDTASGAITGTPTQVGLSRVWFAADSATNGRGLALEVLFNIAAAATTPVITSNGTASAQVGQPFQYVITATNAPTGFGATGLPDGLVVNPTSGVISGLPTAPSTATVTLTATKGTDVSTPKTLTLTIAPAPATPVITSALTANGRVGSLFTYTVTASEGASSFVGEKLPPGLTLNPTSGSLSGTPTESGSISSSVRAGNNAGLGAPATIVFNIAAAATAPVISSAPAVSGKVGNSTAFSYTTVAAPGPITGYGFTGTLPLGLSFNTSTGAITGRPAESGIFTVQLTATNDGGTSAPQTLVLNIAPADDVPIVTSPTFAFGTVGSAFTYQISAVGTPAFPASPFPAPFLLDAVRLPAGLAVNPSTGLIVGVPTVSGTFVATLVGTNSAGTGPFRDLTIVIQPALTAPVITSVPSAAGQVGTPFSYQITGTQNPTGFEVLGSPAWMTVNSGTGAIAGTPTTPGALAVQLIASNASGSSNPVTLNLTVAASPNAPVITSSRAATGRVQSAFTYQITSLVPASAPVVTSYVATGLPTGLSLVSSTGVISGTPLASGQFEVTLIAKSSAGDSQPVTLILTIQPNVTFVF